MQIIIFLSFKFITENLKGWQEGIYFLELNAAGVRYTQKIVKVN